MPICKKCDKKFPNWVTIDGRKKNLCSRKFCLECSPWGKHNTKDITKKEGEYKRKEDQYKGNNCRYCGEIIYKRENVFCNRVCLKKHTTIKRIAKLEAGLLKMSSTIKKALIDKHGENCFICGQNNDWNGKPLTLQADHIDGNSDNNVEKNLRLLCPNCHTQTETFCGGGLPKDTKRNKYLRSFKSK